MGVKAVAKYKTRVQPFGEGWGYYLLVPETAMKAIDAKMRSRLVCTVNGKLTYSCAVMSSGKGGKPCVIFSKQKAKEVGARQGELVSVELKLDKSKYGMPVPDEVKEIFKQDPELRKLFDSLKPGKQRNILFHVSGFKNPETRAERVFGVLDRLKRLTDMKDFYSIFKEPKKGELPAPPVPKNVDAEFFARFLPIDVYEPRESKKPARRRA